jgi:ABC-type Mn2+/Zn2+ transport system permease subunit
MAMFGQSDSRPALRWLFLVMTLVTIGFSIQILGLLFTLGSLFIPTTGLARKGVHLKQHTIEVAMSAAIGSALGLLISLRFTDLPTVPCIALALLGTTWSLRLGTRILKASG